MTTILTLLTVQGIMGAFDNIWHHELTEALPSKPSAWRELTLHSARAFIYGVIFLALGWSTWHGLFAVLLAAVLIVEVGITLWDFLEEDMTRKLPPLERILHTLLAVNYGAVLALLAPVLWTWAQQQSAITLAFHGGLTWIMSFCAGGIFAWSLRDGRAAWRLRPLVTPEWQRRTFDQHAAPSGRTILMTGATGFVGTHVARALVKRGDRLIVLTRNLETAAYKFGPHARALCSLEEIASNEHIDAVINLAGEPVVGLPWTKRRRAAMFESRIGTTEAILDLIRRLTTPPSTLLSASAVGYYADRGDAVLAEDADPGSGFAANLALRWEARAGSASAMRVRTVLLRFGIVLGASRGALSGLVGPTRFGLGAVLGSGRQWVSWLHLDDATRLILHALDTPSMTGPVNATAPQAIRAGEMMKTIARTLHRPLILRVPERILRTCLGEMASVFLDSARVLPTKAEASGFRFRFQDFDVALADLLGHPKPPVRHGATRALTAWTSGKG